jgi:putative DNA primase/helicase
MRLPKALDELARLPNWVIYKTRERNGKKTKPPFQGKHTNEFAKSNDPKTWCDYETATRAVEKLKEPGSGPGFVLTNTNIVAMDLDKCRDAKSGKPLFRWTEDVLALAKDLAGC